MEPTVRLLVAILILLLSACASAGGAPVFEQGQVWRLRDPQFGNAVATIGSIERRGGRRVVHASISGLPGPPSDAVLFTALRQEASEAGRGDQPMHFIVSGYAATRGGMSLTTVDFTMAGESANTVLSLPHIAVYASELRSAVSTLEESGPSPHAMFDVEMRIWRDNERRWPALNNAELGRPFSERIADAMNGAGALASDLDLSQMGPPAPESAGPGEQGVEDSALDARCREIVAPPPLNPRIVADLLRHGYTRDEIPEIDVALSNITVTSSAEWGHIWRADAHNNRSPPESGWSRPVCWRKNADGQPSVTSYPRPEEER